MKTTSIIHRANPLATRWDVEPSVLETDGQAQNRSDPPPPVTCEFPVSRRLGAVLGAVALVLAGCASPEDSPTRGIDNGDQSNTSGWIVTFDANGGMFGDAATKDVSVPKGFMATEPAPPPVKEGSVLTGWYAEKETTHKFNLSTQAITGALTLFAGWKVVEREFAVTDQDTWDYARKELVAGASDQIKNYVITIKNSNVLIKDSTSASFGPKFINVEIRGEGKAASLGLSSVDGGHLLYIGENQTVEVNNLTLQGKKNTKPLIYVLSGALCLNEGAKLTGNSNSSTDGGGVYMQGGSLTMTNSVISGNTLSGSGAQGGGVFAADSSAVEMSGTAQVSGNTANAAGGGVYLNGGSSLTMSGSAAVTGNTASTFGGGVFVASGGKLVMGKEGSAENAVISGNTAGSHGGGAYVADGSLTMTTGAAVLKNTSTAGSGGGVFVTGEAGTFTMEGTAAVSANEAKGVSNTSATPKVYNGGGGVAVANGASFTLKGSAVVGGSSAADSNKASGSYGGGVLVNTGARAEMSGEGAKVSYNTVGTNGTGVCVRGSNGKTGEDLIGSVFVIKDGAEISNNAATTSAGSALYVEGGGEAFLEDGAKIMNNTGQYGTVYAADGGTVTMKDGATISGNTCSNNGGGFHINKGKVIMLGGTVKDNTSKEQGGGVYMNYSPASFTMSGGSITGNTGKTHGGVAAIQGTFIMTKNGPDAPIPVIANNTGAAGGGGVGGVGGNTVFQLTDGVIYGADAAVLKNTGAASKGALDGTARLGTFVLDEESGALVFTPSMSTAEPPAAVTVVSSNDTLLVKDGVREVYEDPEVEEPEPEEPTEG